MLTRGGKKGEKKKTSMEKTKGKTAQEKRIIHEKCSGKLLRHLVLGHCKHMYVNADIVFVAPGEVS